MVIWKIRRYLLCNGKTENVREVMRENGVGGERQWRERGMGNEWREDNKQLPVSETTGEGNQVLFILFISYHSSYQFCSGLTHVDVSERNLSLYRGVHMRVRGGSVLAKGAVKDSNSTRGHDAAATEIAGLSR